MLVMQFQAIPSFVMQDSVKVVKLKLSELSAKYCMNLYLLTLSILNTFLHLQFFDAPAFFLNYGEISNIC